MNKKNKIPFTVLIIIDAWGIAPPGDNNAISQANTPFFDSLTENYPIAVLSSVEDSEFLPEDAYKILGVNNKTLAEKEPVSFGLSLGRMGLKQVRLGESEGIALLTEFFDQGQLLNSADYKVKIVSSAILKDRKNVINKINNQAVRIIKKNQVDFMALNLLGIDLACQTKDKDGIIYEIEAVDSFVKNITENIIDQKGQLIIVGSFGHAERFYDINSGKKELSITNNPLPLVVVAERFLGKNFNWPNPAGTDLSTLKPIASIFDFAPSLLSFLKKEDGQGDFIIEKE